MNQTAKIPVCISLPTEQLRRLDQVADAMDRGRSYVASKAIDAFLEQNSGRFSALQDGDQTASAPPVKTPSGGGGRLPRPRGRHQSDQDVCMDTPAYPRVSDLARQNAVIADRKAEQRRQAADVTRQNAEYLKNLGKP
jgi:predicted transcriptional regulator